MISGIQIILLSFLGLLIIRTLKRFRGGMITQLGFFGWILLWLFGSIFVINPDSANRIADILGVGRGADVVLYVGLILVFYLLFKLFNRTITIEQDITRLVRSLALKDEKDKHDKDT